MSVQYKQLPLNGKKTIIGRGTIDPKMQIHLVIGFHGAESTPENMLVHGNRLRLDNAILAYPEGPVDAGEGRFSWWKDGPRQKETVEKFLVHSGDVIDAARLYASQEYPEAAVRVSLWGFSQGAAAALVYALLGTRPIHKVASLCGFLPEIPDAKEEPSTRASILGLFGSHDEVVPSFLAEHALEEMKTRGHASLIRELPQGHEVKEENLIEINEFLKD